MERLFGRGFPAHCPAELSQGGVCQSQSWTDGGSPYHGIENAPDSGYTRIQLSHPICKAPQTGKGVGQMSGIMTDVQFVQSRHIPAKAKVSLRWQSRCIPEEYSLKQRIVNRLPA